MEDPRITARRESHKVRGRPIQTPENKAFATSRAFQEALISNRADRTKTQRQRNTEEATLISRRRRQLGE